MTAARLRDAAQKIRDTADGAQTTTIPGGWTAEGFHYVSGLLEGDLEQIVLWSPPVALAVADWLDRSASEARLADNRQALTLADLILGSPS